MVKQRERKLQNRTQRVKPYPSLILTQLYTTIRAKYRIAHEKPARRLVDQRGRRTRTVYRKLNKCKCKVLTG